MIQESMREHLDKGNLISLQISLLIGFIFNPAYKQFYIYLIILISKLN